MRADPATYIDQSADELRLNLLCGDLDLGQFTLLQNGIIALPGVSVDASVIGASHVVRLRIGPERDLHEVFACTDVVADARRFFSGPVARLREPLELRLEGGATYRFSARARRLAESRLELRSLEQRAQAGAGRPDEIGLRFAFPTPGRPAPAPPETVVWVLADAAERSVRIETAHSYPNEGTVVFSETLVTSR